MACCCGSQSQCNGTNYANDCPVHSDPCINPQRQDCCRYWRTAEDRYYRFADPLFKCCPGACVGSGGHSFPCMVSLGLNDNCCPDLLYADVSRINRTTISWMGRTKTASREGDENVSLVFNESGVDYRASVLISPSSVFGYWTRLRSMYLSSNFPFPDEVERCPDSSSLMCQRRGRVVISAWNSITGLGGKVINLLYESPYEESSFGTGDIPSYSVSWRNNTGCANPLP